jgi:hypothetical protein
VPDILGRIRPILASVLPWREPDERVTALKPWVRRLVTGYVLVLVPAIAFIFLMLLINAPRVLATGWDSFWLHWDRVGPFFSAGETARGAMSVFQMIVLVLPAAGLAYSTGRIGHRAGRFGWRWSDGSPTRRAALVAGTAAAVALAAFLLWPHGAYRPISRGRRARSSARSGRSRTSRRGARRSRSSGSASSAARRRSAGSNARAIPGRSTRARSRAGSRGARTRGPLPATARRPRTLITRRTPPPVPEDQPTQPAPTTTAPAPTTTEPAPAPTPTETSTAPEPPPATETTPTETSTDTTTTPTAP